MKITHVIVILLNCRLVRVQPSVVNGCRVMIVDDVISYIYNEARVGGRPAGDTRETVLTFVHLGRVAGVRHATHPLQIVERLDVLRKDDGTDYQQRHGTGHEHDNRPAGDDLIFIH